jgi:hypothetical protein
MRYMKVIQVLAVITIFSCLSCDHVQESTINNPPAEPSDLFVSYIETDSGPQVQLNWHSSDPDGDTLLYDIYFGTNQNPPVIATNIAQNYYNPGSLIEDSIYFWKVTARDIQGNSVSGPISTFKFILAGSGIPALPFPPDGSIGVDIFPNLTWQCPSHISDTFLYDVYFGTDSAMELVSAGQIEREYNTHWIEQAIMRRTLEQINAGQESYLCCDTHVIAWAGASSASAENPYAFSDIGVYINSGDVYSYNLDNIGVYNWSVRATANLDDDPDLDIWGTDEIGYLYYINSDFHPYYQPNQKYYWRVVTKKQNGEEISSPLWQFETSVNTPPNTPGDPVPGNNETDAGIETVLHWQVLDPDPGMTYMVYDIYFGPNPDPPLAVSNYALNKYNPRWSFRTEAYDLLLQIYAAQQRYYIDNGTYWGRGTSANASAPDAFSPIGVEIPESSMYTYTIILADASDLYVQATASFLDFDADYDVVDIDRTGDISILLDDFNNPSYFIDTTYYWKIVATDNYGAQTTGPVWQFRTPANSNPHQPIVYCPDDGGTVSPVDVKLGWTCFDPDGDGLSYDIYLGTEMNPPLIVSNAEAFVHIESTLESGQTYYWKIVAKDDRGHQTEGPVWSFTTE